MTSRDIFGLLISYVYAGGLLLSAEALSRSFGLAQDVTRKMVHIGAGLWVFGVLALFDTWYIGIIPFATFIGLNYFFYRYRIFRSIDSNTSSPGTVYFAFSITLLFLLFWRSYSPDDKAAFAAAGAMAMTLGDATAAIVGQRFGRRRYTVLGTTRSFEGSTAMFVVSTIAIWFCLRFIPGSALSPLATPFTVTTAMSAAIGAALVATLAEAVAPYGSDNLSVPLLAGLGAYAVVMSVH
jgi:dolichol kinase